MAAMYPVQGVSSLHVTSLTAALCWLMVVQAAVSQGVSSKLNCSSLTEGVEGLVGNNCSLSSEPEKGLVGRPCTMAVDCFDGLQCALNKTCACPQGCDYFAAEVACSCGSEWADSSVILLLVLGFPFNALLWFGCFYRTKQNILGKGENDEGRSSDTKIGDVDTMPMVPTTPDATPNNLFAVSEAGSVLRGPLPQPPQYGSQLMPQPPTGLPLETVPSPPAYYPPKY